MKNDGYIALISVIILGAILLAVVASISSVTFYQASNGLDGESKERAFALAYSCLDHALLKKAQDGSYTGNETYFVGADQCAIGVITADQNGNFIIPASAVIGGASANLSVLVDKTTLQTITFSVL